MWHTLKSLSFESFIETIIMILESFPPAFVIVISAGLFILCALAVKRVLF